MGIQSGSERIRKDIFKRQGTNSEIIKVSKLIKESGIILSVDNIFGSPTETEKELKEGLKIYKEIRPDRISTYWLTYYPKTSIIKQEALSFEQKAGIKSGNTGFVHSTGSVKQSKISLYKKYQLLFHLTTLSNSETLHSIFSKLPFKSILSKIIMIINMVKNKDLKTYYTLKYILARKNIP